MGGYLSEAKVVIKDVGLLAWVKTPSFFIPKHGSFQCNIIILPIISICMSVNNNIKQASNLFEEKTRMAKFIIRETQLVRQIDLKSSFSDI